MVRTGLPLLETTAEPSVVVHTWLLPIEPVAKAGMVIMATVIPKANLDIIFMLNSSLVSFVPIVLGYFLTWFYLTW